MTTLLSDDDFQRLQSQLLELRTRNYTLEEKSTKYHNEAKQLQQHLESLKQEFNRAQRTIQRSKTARDFEQILQENERLQNKLQSQEDEFRLQNETLMQEVISLSATNEKLKKDVEMHKTEMGLSSEKEIHNDLLRLQAESNALKKLLNERNCGNGNNEATESGDAIGKQFDSELKVATEAEEKNILKMKILELQKVHQENVLQLQTENEKLKEKLKKKQDIIGQLHEEKEKMYLECQKACETLKDEKQVEIQKLQMELHVLSSRTKNTLHERLSNTELSGCETDATVELIDGEKAAFDCSVNETKLALQETELKLHDLENQLKNCESLVKKLEEEKSGLEQEKHSLLETKKDLESVIVEKSNLAEERKGLMEKMNSHLLETNNKHSKEIESLTKQLAKEQDALQKLFNKEKETRVELLEAQNEIQNLKKEIEQLKNDHSTSQEDLEKLLKSQDEENESLKEQLQQQQEMHESSITELENNFKAHEEDFNIQIEVARAEKTEFEEKVVVLQQELKDQHDEKKIIEKKNASLCKDLRRQLVAERKRAEKLQERLQEFLNEHNRSVEEILQSANGEKPKGDASSVSSWSYVSAEAAEREIRDNPSHSDGSSCERDSPSRQSPNTLENETTNLLGKVTYLQQRNWVLDEKVNHLEMSNEALVDDLLKKTAIIQYYCMEGRSNAHAVGAQDKLTIKRIVDFIKDKGDENLREINRKMQRMLEETLTKNMHLQKDIETLSNEVTRLSKLTEATINGDLQNTMFGENV